MESHQPRNVLQTFAWMLGQRIMNGVGYGNRTRYSAVTERGLSIRLIPTLTGAPPGIRTQRTCGLNAVCLPVSSAAQNYADPYIPAGVKSRFGCGHPRAHYWRSVWVSIPSRRLERPPASPAAHGTLIDGGSGTKPDLIPITLGTASWRTARGLHPLRSG